MPVKFAFDGTRPLFAGLRAVARGRTVPTGISSSVGTSFSIPAGTGAGSVLALLSLAGTSDGSGTWSLSGGTWAARVALSATTGATVVTLTLTDATGLAGGSSGTITARYVGESVDLTTTLTVSVVASGAGVLHTFTMAPTAASSTGMFRLGLGFEPSELNPSTQRLKVREQGGSDIAFAALANYNTWSDGSAFSTAGDGLVCIDGTLSAGKTYEVYAETGSQPASSFDPWAWIAANANDFTVDVTSRTGSVSGPMGSLSFSLKTAIATTARREIQVNTARYVTVMCWQLPSSADPHLVCINYLKFWLNSGGAAPVAVEWTPVLSQHWFVNNPFGTVATKEKQTYNATVKYGSTTLRSDTALGHSYNCRWAAVRGDDDAEHAHPFWIDLGSTPMPRLNRSYSVASRKKMARIGLLPPMEWDANVTYTQSLSYTPLGLNGYESGLSATGPHAGRGIASKYDCTALVNQTATNWRAALVAAHAGLSFYAHFMDHRTTHGMGLIPLPFYTLNGGSNSYSGLGTEIVAVKLAVSNATPWGSLTYSSPSGGTAPFGISDSAHNVNFSGTAAFVFGERYLADSAMCNWDYWCRQSNWNELGHAGADLHYDDATFPDRNIPATRMGAVMLMSQERTWNCNMLRSWHVLCGDADRHRGYTDNYVRSMANWHQTVVDNVLLEGGEQAEFGVFYADGSIHSPGSMATFTTISCAALSLTVEGADKAAFVAAADMACGWLPRLVANGNLGSLHDYRNLALLYPRGVNTKTFAPRAYSFLLDEIASVNTNTFTASGSEFRTGIEPANGDRFYFSPQMKLYADASVPTGYSFGTMYYVQQWNSSTKTFRLSTDQAGTNLVSHAAQTGSFAGTYSMASAYALDFVGEGGTYYPADDNYIWISRATAKIMHLAGCPSVTSGTLDAINDYTSVKTEWPAFPGWAFSEDQA